MCRTLCTYVEKARTKMKISYIKLRHLLLDRNMKMTRLAKKAGICEAVAAKLNKDQKVSLTVLLKICETLKCNFGDIIDAVPNNSTDQK